MKMEGLFSTTKMKISFGTYPLESTFLKYVTTRIYGLSRCLHSFLSFFLSLSLWTMRVASTRHTLYSYSCLKLLSAIAINWSLICMWESLLPELIKHKRY